MGHALMPVSWQNAELTQFVSATTMTTNVFALRVTLEIHRLHAIHVSFLYTERFLTVFAKKECILQREVELICLVYFTVVPQTEPTLAAGCANDDECPDHTACENRLCINPCAYRDPCARNAYCKVLNHQPVCTCPDGYIGDPKTECKLRKTTYMNISYDYMKI